MQQDIAPVFTQHHEALVQLKESLASLDRLGAHTAAAHLSLAIAHLEEDILELIGETRH